MLGGRGDGERRRIVYLFLNVLRSRRDYRDSVGEGAGRGRRLSSRIRSPESRGVEFQLEFESNSAWINDTYTYVHKEQQKEKPEGAIEREREIVQESDREKESLRL